MQENNSFFFSCLRRIPFCALTHQENQSLRNLHINPFSLRITTMPTEKLAQLLRQNNAMLIHKHGTYLSVVLYFLMLSAD